MVNTNKNIRKYKNQPYTKDFLIKEFFRYQKEFGKYPLKKDIHNTKGYPSMAGYNRIWNSWDDFLKEIGVVDQNTTDGWYKVDEQVLKDLYSTGSKDEIIEKLIVKRNWDTIKRKASSLNLKRDISAIKRKYTNKYLIEHLINLSKKIGRTPRIKDLKKMEEKISRKSYDKYFGSWNQALLEAGLNINLLKKHNKDEIMEGAIKFFKENKRSPFYNELDHSATIVYNYWDTWGEFLAECKLPPTMNYHNLKTKTDGINLLKRVYKETKKIPSPTVVTNYYKVNSAWFRNKFGSWNQALHEAKIIDLNDISSPDRLISQSIEILRSMYKKLGRCPKVTEFEEETKWNPYLNRRRLEKHFNKSYLEICSVFLDKSVNPRKTKETLAEELINLAENLNRTPQQKDLSKYNLSSLTTYIRTFKKSFSGILEELGIEISYTIPKIKNDEELLQDYKNLYNELGYLPLSLDINNCDSMCSYSVYVSRFSELKNVWELLDLDYTDFVGHKIGYGISYVDKNGDLCRSSSELTITNFL
ncbi:homing endonuclease associated repeat-containing protein, partial [Bacillus paralicheniformis]|uniref:homing endonuclease associated repeat-containing protein n=1 Tax=Bacillus paralicheniformis TaxID=1648923 RepID=UPI00364361D0